VHEYEREVHILQARIKERLASEDVDFLDIPEGEGGNFNKYNFFMFKTIKFQLPKKRYQQVLRNCNVTQKELLTLCPFLQS
jgi:hypothetical protein